MSLRANANTKDGGEEREGIWVALGNNPTKGCNYNTYLQTSFYVKTKNCYLVLPLNTFPSNILSV